uniref:Proteasome-activating nucleotidase n=1 Tax=Talaromyces marneffei PM1 TaxID=1077442 RepID=A0A093VS44_TALMA
MSRRDRLHTTRSSPFCSEDPEGIPANVHITTYVDEDDGYNNGSSDDSRHSFDEERAAPTLEAKSKNEYSSSQNHKYVQNNKPYISVVYLDHPRLFKGDSKMSALRGREKVADVSKYLERHKKNINFIVTKTFHCFQYANLEFVERLFHHLSLPDDPKVPESIRPYFFSLRTNSPPARPAAETMRILSEALKDALVAVTGMSHKEISHLEDATNMIMLHNSIYYYSHIKERTFGTLNSKEILHLSDLLEYMQLTNRLEWEEADAQITQGLITQEHMAKLYGPNQVLVTTENGYNQAYMLTKPPYSEEVGGDSRYKMPITLDLWSWQFNGSFYKKDIKWSLSWPSSAPPDEAIPIYQLEIYPLRFASSEVVDRLKARGRIFWKCRHARFVAYDPPNAILEFHTSNPRYMVDGTTYQQMHGTSSSPQDDLGPEAMKKEEPPDSSFVLLLPHEIYGFGMHDKKWRTLLVEHIKDIDWNEGAFDRLVLQHSKKELIKALVTVHTISAKSTDIIEGKGNALIMLLHGGPGTGKTLTAESVAELTRKPLYRVTCGDIGTNAEEVEKYLESVLLIGTIWGCVVLLDEADVFLEERRETDLQRNALVSVFLRVLEYYDGILILTSNRIGTFDSAFKSRFQLAIHYPALNVEGRYEIWLNFINGLSKTNPDVKIDDLKSHIQELAADKLNGREIRNIVRTSLQLAHFRQTTLDYQHFQQVIGVAKEFERHIDETRGYSDSDWNRSRGIRPD